MDRKKPEQIVQLLHKIDGALAQGKVIEDLCREEQISPATYHRWKKKYDGLSVQAHIPHLIMAADNNFAPCVQGGG